MMLRKLGFIGGCCLILTGLLGAVTEKDLIDPKPELTLVEQLEKAGEFKTLLAAAQAAELVVTLQGKESFTLLAPTDAAFSKLPPTALEELLLPANKQKLAGVITLHLIRGKNLIGPLFAKKKVTTFQGQMLPFRIMAGSYMVDTAQILQADILCANGVIHIIDRVLLPLD
jgi:transforming growth factor-beta-induced protein